VPSRSRYRPTAKGTIDVNESASDGDASRVVVLSSAKSAIAFLLAGAVGTLGPSVLAISASGEVPLAVVIATLF
jgi:hypothetical protein